MRKQNAELVRATAQKIAKKHGKAIRNEIKKFVKGKDLTPHEVQRLYGMTSGFLKYTELG